MRWAVVVPAFMIQTPPFLPFSGRPSVCIVAPGTEVRIHLLSTNVDLKGTIARRDPSADPGTRTVHCEVDLADPTRIIPVGTTAELVIEVARRSLAVMCSQAIDWDTANKRPLQILNDIQYGLETLGSQLSGEDYVIARLLFIIRQAVSFDPTNPTNNLTLEEVRWVAKKAPEMLVVIKALMPGENMEKWLQQPSAASQ